MAYGIIYGLFEGEAVRYIGQTIDEYGRRKRHKHTYDTGKGCRNPHLINWLTKLRREGRPYEFRVMAECNNEAGLIAAEVLLIAWHRTTSDLCNVTPGGERGRPGPRTAEEIEKARAAFNDPEYAARHRRAVLEGKARWLGLTVEQYQDQVRMRKK